MWCVHDGQKLAQTVNLELSNGFEFKRRRCSGFVLLCNQEHWSDPELKGLVKILDQFPSGSADCGDPLRSELL